MIKYINYNYDGGVEIYDGLLKIDEFTSNDIRDAINHRLNAIPNKEIISTVHHYSDETCFLVSLAFDLNKFDQFFEKINDKLILNFCDKHFISYYSISFSNEKYFSKNIIFEKSHIVTFSTQLKAPLINIEEVRQKLLPISFFNLKTGRMHFLNYLYYKYNSVGFCLPVEQLIRSMVQNGEIKKYIENIIIKIDDDFKINIHINTLKHAYGKRHWENNYYGYLDLNSFSIIIEKHEEELLSG